MKNSHTIFVHKCNPLKHLIANIPHNWFRKQSIPGDEIHKIQQKVYLTRCKGEFHNDWVFTLFRQFSFDTLENLGGFFTHLLISGSAAKKFLIENNTFMVEFERIDDLTIFIMIHCHRITNWESQLLKRN